MHMRVKRSEEDRSGQRVLVAVHRTDCEIERADRQSPAEGGRDPQGFDGSSKTGYPKGFEKVKQGGKCEGAENSKWIVYVPLSEFQRVKAHQTLVAREHDRNLPDQDGPQEEG